MAEGIGLGVRKALASTGLAKPNLPFLRILQMNIGFLGLQYSFGLQQSEMTPIYGALGSSEAILPLLFLAGPVTGLIVQPIIGAMSDATVSRWGRRTPYFLIGAILCSITLAIMPFSSALWMAVCVLWIMDAANNTTQQPYRAYISDRLNDSQQSAGFLTQSAFTGLGQTLAYLTPSLLVWWGFGRDAVGSNNIQSVVYIAFEIGAVLSISSILWSIFSVPELPLSEAERLAIGKRTLRLSDTLRELWRAAIEMPPDMRRMIPMMFFQWYAMFLYWQYIIIALARGLFGTVNPNSPLYHQAFLINGQVGAFYNLVAFIAAFAMVPLARRVGLRGLHAVCMVAAGVGLLILPWLHSEGLILIAVFGVGLGWASMMGNPFVMLARIIPPGRTGVYMGFFNLFIVVPMLIQTVTVPLYYNWLLGGDARKAITLAGVLLLLAAVSTFLIRVPVHSAAEREAA